MGQKRTYYKAFKLLIIFTCEFCSCRQQGRLPPELEEGRRLALIHCSSCHLTPDPSLLDKPTWQRSVLPAMAQGLGIGVYMKSQYFPNPARAQRAPVSMDEWNKIVKFYVETAPQHLTPAKPSIALQKGWSLFKLKSPALGSIPAGTTLVHYDSTTNEFLTSDALAKKLQTWDQSLTETRSFPIAAPIVNAAPTGIPNDKNLILTNIGILFPTDKPAGSFAAASTSGKTLALKQIAGDLRRPVQTIAADFNEDGIMDYSVCSFGNTMGGLFLFTGNKYGTYTRKAIREVPGAEQEITGDFNHDGWPDLMVLFAQADEGIWMFLNDRHGGFKTVNVLRFPSVFGSTSFALCDFNKDGNLDILYTSGDNADYSPILKPYHGVYIFQNTGDWHFKQRWFYPVNGCIKAIPADFNMDDRMDIASIAFTPDFKNRSEEACIYFEQDKPMHFIPHALPVDRLGRWICMQVSDIDRDGDKDIILGSFSLPQRVGAAHSENFETRLPFIVLENQHINLRRVAQRN